jgi:hypothetical protein
VGSSSSSGRSGVMTLVMCMVVGMAKSAAGVVDSTQ